MVFRRSLLWTIVCLCVNAQVIDFESNGLHYKTLTRSGITVMFATLPVHIRDYDIMQVAISNGSRISWAVKPEDFRVSKSGGGVFQARPAMAVVGSVFQRSRRACGVQL